jgi:hypothetical protein
MHVDPKPVLASGQADQAPVTLANPDAIAEQQREQALAQMPLVSTPQG